MSIDYVMSRRLRKSKLEHDSLPINTNLKLIKWYIVELSLYKTPNHIVMAFVNYA